MAAQPHWTALMYPMERSSRSTPTGPGSRGGRWHEPDYPKTYWRSWRAAHPEYREREAERKRREREAAADERVMPTLTDALRYVVGADVEATSHRRVGVKLMIDHTTVSRFLAGAMPSGDLVDAIVTVYGFDAVVRATRRLRRVARHGPG